MNNTIITQDSTIEEKLKYADRSATEVAFATKKILLTILEEDRTINKPENKEHYDAELENVYRQVRDTYNEFKEKIESVLLPNENKNV